MPKRDKVSIGIILLGLASTPFLFGEYLVFDGGNQLERARQQISPPPQKTTIQQYRSAAEEAGSKVGDSGWQTLKALERELITTKYQNAIASEKQQIAMGAIKVEQARAELDALKRVETHNSNSMEQGPYHQNPFSPPKDLYPQAAVTVEDTISDAPKPEETVILNKINIDGSAVITVSGYTAIVHAGSSVGGVQVLSVNRKRKSVEIKGIKSGNTRQVILNTNVSRIYAQIEPRKSEGSTSGTVNENVE